MGGTMDKLPLPLGLATPLKAMTTDPLLQQWFARDPLIGRRIVLGRFFRSLHQYRPVQPDLALKCPLLLVHPGADSWTSTAMSMPAYEAVPAAKRLRVLTNGSHLPAEAPAWAELCEEIGDFLESSRAKHSS
jgi:alpha-beta hydrolase superfamily lysophospholipase